MKKIVFIPLAAFLIFGCHSETEPEGTLLRVDASRISQVRIDIPDDGVVVLDTAAGIGRVDRMMLPGEEIILVADGRLVSFDAGSGAFVRQFSRRGRAMDEYVSLWSAWCDDSCLCLYDFNAKKILDFSLSGELLENIDLSSKKIPFQTLIRLDEKGFVGKRVFGLEKVPELSLFDNDYNYSGDCATIPLRSGLHLHYPFSKVEGEDRVLYNPYFSNEIWEISREGSAVKYTVDFMERNVPLLKQFKDEYEIMDFLQSSKGGYSSLISNLYESERFLCFSFVSNPGRKLYHVHDKVKGRSGTVEFQPEDAVVCTMGARRDTLFVLFQTESHTCFKSFALDSLEMS